MNAAVFADSGREIFRDSLPARNFDLGKCRMCSIKTYKDLGIRAPKENDAAGLAFLVGFRRHRVCSSSAEGISVAHREQMVLLERFDEFAHIRLGRSARNTELACELFRDFGLRRALLQEFQDS